MRDTDPLAYTRRVLANARIDAWRLGRREVADELAVTVGTVKAAASRGLTRLRIELGDDEGRRPS